MADPQHDDPARQPLSWLKAKVQLALARLAAAVVFYTCIPLPATWVLEFQTVARLAPVVGLLLGGGLGLLDFGLQQLGMPVLTRSTVVVMVWVAVTGGLHLDGVMDTADGLAVTQPQRRLQVMTDSATGAFGAMAAIALLLLKTAALSDLPTLRWGVLAVAAGWGRWGQQVAIACYPYLKPTGKGAFHKAALPSAWDIIPGLLLMLGVCLLLGLGQSAQWRLVVGLVAGGAIAFGMAAWFSWQLGGHTGDTYGAVVEWAEAGVLVLGTLLL
ncbi:adenosylcobinamide-GDP ribazoletransferase [Oculatella sp. LEGE 06141]|uniref:adenosylcobinamide-GDP ribazoletransferase n=1 Tax=Oculatella sp. LEGE 06141 TaxID=1828648 RepID=UPI00187F7422|nr:adenosylcobinamide-GDP ribazoletransferase [Oculatella sp. LEGE 06141]MBE9180679.1 adenosylcobinamide-GDP ribazoletransferase [Oculatella sp. LEGE 06141]